jgi:hypothetical protein
MMGDKVNGLGVNLLGWATAVVTFLAAAFLVGSWLARVTS